MGKKTSSGRKTSAGRDAPLTHLIRTPKQLRVLRTAARQQVFAAIHAMEVCSVAELAARLRRPAGSLYYHIQLLRAARLIREVDRRRAGKRWESIYAPVAPRIKIDTANRSAAFFDEIRYAQRSLLRATERELQQALERAREQQNDLSQTALLRRLNLRLRPRAAARFAKMLNELEAFAVAHDDPSAPESYVCTYAWYRQPRAAASR